MSCSFPVTCQHVLTIYLVVEWTEWGTINTAVETEYSELSEQKQGRTAFSGEREKADAQGKIQY